MLLMYIALLKQIKRLIPIKMPTFSIPKTGSVPKTNPPEILAERVYKYLKDKKVIRDRRMATRLEHFFKTLYYASMRTEEGQLIQVSVTFFDPETEDLIGDEDDSQDHWSYTSFEEPLEFNEKTLVKLSKAADPWSSSIAVYFNEKGELLIYGLIDQALHSQRFVNHESETQPKHAGLFQASIQGIGIIAATDGYKMIGVLRQDSLARQFNDVWKYGQISELIEEKSGTFVNIIGSFIAKRYPGLEIEDYMDFIHDVWRDSLSRILIQIRKYNHGGALLITSKTDGLVINYPMQYIRLRGAILRFIRTSISLRQVEKQISMSRDYIERELFDELRSLETKKQQVNNELKGAIRFIASQSCVDGLIVMKDNLSTFGFGAVIDKIDPPEFIHQARGSKFSTTDPKRPKNFGTRHRSMMTYCSRHPGSIGIVISQDGELRVMSQFDDKLVVWDNVKIQKYLRSKIIL
ncbi:putative sensor domain DACNV-containing protein [Pedobacter sp. KBW01]|uniref:putative sensor domain DACNV-containing protein n=1 Tax=Pedobacter sp. KBW01 TaxID=2153364 RepID=UPI000F596D2D|nr:hypothetical protein [Pedobacter sp. KBW01]